LQYSAIDSTECKSANDPPADNTIRIQQHSFDDSIHHPIKIYSYDDILTLKNIPIEVTDLKNFHDKNHIRFIANLKSDVNRISVTDIQSIKIHLIHYE
jgi:hypothetical protein